MSVMQIYERPVALDRNVHQEVRIQGNNFNFARTCQTAILAAVELNQAIKDFPVVFVKENEHFLPLAVFALQQNQNLFVDADGQWTARYIPAFIRRYPFVPALGQKPEDPMTVCIDEAAECISKEAGEPLFVDGKNSALLDNAIKLLDDYKLQTDVTQVLVKQLADAGLLSEKTVNLQINGGPTFNLTGFLTLDTEKMAALTPAAVYELVKSGAMHIAYLHLTSLDNWNYLINLQAKRLESEASKPAVAANEPAAV